MRTLRRVSVVLVACAVSAVGIEATNTRPPVLGNTTARSSTRGTQTSCFYNCGALTFITRQIDIPEARA
jgi:hypothetical protein